MGNRKDHDEVSALLPWFVNDSLRERDTRQVLRHLKDCSECREERDRLQAIAGLVAEDQLAAADYRPSFRALMARIDDAEARAATNQAALVTPAVHRRNRLPALAVAASLAVALLLVANLAPDTAEPGFRTLTAPTAVTPGEARRMSLGFDQPIRAETLRKALIETQSNIISGPDAGGSYLIEVQVPATASDSQYIESIRAIDGVRFARFAEP